VDGSPGQQRKSGRRRGTEQPALSKKHQSPDAAFVIRKLAIAEECAFNGRFFGGDLKNGMANKKEKKAPETPEDKKEKEEEKLLEEHPYETMSQVRNRYGHGREKNGSEGSEKGAERLNH
jgi:hypothetical protein